MMGGLTEESIVETFFTCCILRFKSTFFTIGHGLHILIGFGNHDNLVTMVIFGYHGNNGSLLFSYSQRGVQGPLHSYCEVRICLCPKADKYCNTYAWREEGGLYSLRILAYAIFRKKKVEFFFIFFLETMD